MTKETIIAVAKAHGYTQVAIAEAMGISRQALDKSLNSDLRASTMERIAEAIGISVAEFYGATAQCRCPHCGNEIKIKIE